MRLIQLMLLAAAIGGALTGCAGLGAADHPILDGAPGPTYTADLDDCRALALRQRQFDQETAAAVVLGAGTGALLGHVDDDGDALGGAVAGALAGGIASAVHASDRREAIVIACLRGRGHRVVG